jgi:pimeloyl-ACP methyl ester carboxylesterase
MADEGHGEGGGGQRPLLICLQGPGAPRVTPAHDLLAARFRLIVLEPPGASSDTLAAAIARPGPETFDLLATSAGAEAALRLALQEPRRVRALVLEAPTLGDAGLERRLSEVTAPTLVLVGTRDDAAATEAARRVKERVPDCHLVFVYDAGGAIAAERPEAFAEVVSDFLERHEAFVISRARSVIHP